EVYSEQEVRMAYMVIEEPPKGEFEQQEVIGLSDGRRIEVSLSFKDVRPDLSVVYYNPSSRTEAAAPLVSVEEHQGVLRDERENKLDRLLACLRWITAGPRSAIIIGAILVAIWLIIDRPGRPTAGGILGQAAAAEVSLEQQISSQPDRVFRRTIELEELRPDNQVIARRRVEVWRNAAKQLLVRRLYDENGLLIAGEWRRAKGASKFYRRRAEPGAKQSLSIEPNNSNGTALRSDRLVTLDDLWRLDLSTTEFKDFVSNLGPATIEERPGAYVIGYQLTSQGLAQGLVSATLTLNRGDLRPTEQRFRFRYANEDRVVRFVEKLFDHRPLEAVGERVFEVEPE